MELESKDGIRDGSACGFSDCLLTALDRQSPALQIGWVVADFSNVILIMETATKERKTRLERASLARRTVYFKSETGEELNVRAMLDVPTAVQRAKVPASARLPTVTAGVPSFLRGMFVGADGLRAGWGLVSRLGSTKIPLA